MRQIKTRTRPKPSVAALILYEDRTTGLRAKLIPDNNLDQLGSPAAGAPELLRLDLLRWTGCRRWAARAAAKADLVFLSAHGNHDWPAAVLDWLYLWLHQPRICRQALAILLDRAQRRTVCVQELLDSLNILTYTEGVTVFCNFKEAIPEAINSIQDHRCDGSFPGKSGEPIIAREA